MNAKTKVLIGAGVAGAVALTFVVGLAGLWLASSAVVQVNTLAQSGVEGSCHDNQSFFELLGLSQPGLLAQRQADQRLLEIAKAIGVGEDKLTNALIQPMNRMHARWTETNGDKSSADQMSRQMQDQFAKDLRGSQFGTMTDFHLGLGGDSDSSMIGGTYACSYDNCPPNEGTVGSPNAPFGACVGLFRLV